MTVATLNLGLHINMWHKICWGHLAMADGYGSSPRCFQPISGNPYPTHIRPISISNPYPTDIHIQPISGRYPYPAHIRQPVAPEQIVTLFSQHVLRHSCYQDYCPVQLVKKFWIKTFDTKLTKNVCFGCGFCVFWKWPCDLNLTSAKRPGYPTLGETEECQ